MDRFNKKSQAAMEFLMTYGWAIMVILLALGALAYFGVLNPSNLLPEKCTFPTGFQCEDYVVSAEQNKTSLRIINGKGEGVIISKINITDNEGYFSGCSIDFSSDNDACLYVDPNASNICKDNDSGTGYNQKTGWYLQSSEIGTISIPCDTIVDYEGKTRADIYLTWYKASSNDTFAHTEVGELLAKASS
jgi:hypothetical protein